MTPRERFRNNADLLKVWSDIVTSAQFTAACDAAMLEFQNSFPPATDMATSAASEWKRQGAKHFLQILIGLSYQAPPVGPMSGAEKELEYKR